MPAFRAFYVGPRQSEGCQRGQSGFAWVDPMSGFPIYCFESDADGRIYYSAAHEVLTPAEFAARA